MDTTTSGGTDNRETRRIGEVSVRAGTLVRAGTTVGLLRSPIVVFIHFDSVSFIENGRRCCVWEQVPRTGKKYGELRASNRMTNFSGI